MMKFTLLAAVAASAAAFAPSVSKSSSTALNGYENEIGTIAPTGFFDPLGLSRGISQATFDQYRAAEVKHGRVAQLAVCGYIAQEFLRFPGIIAPGVPFADIPNGFGAVTAVPAAGWAQIFFMIGYVELEGAWRYDSGIPDLDDETMEKRMLQELQHGRIAMLGIMEIFRHECTHGADGLGENLLPGFPFLYN